jgi:RNA polymerase sigma-70 factor, ECF subfamily
VTALIPVAADRESTTPESDKRLLFECEVAPLRDVLYRVACQLTSNGADAENLLQDTMLKAYSAFGSFAHRNRVKAWLVRIMRNIWIDGYRWSERRPAEWLTGNFADWERDAYDRHNTTSRASVSTHFVVPSSVADVRQVIKALPESLGRALYYAYVEDFPYKEIARIEDIPVGTVMWRLYRGRRQLRGLLVEHSPESCIAVIAEEVERHEQ